MHTTTCTHCGATRPSFEAICPTCLVGRAVEQRVDVAEPAAGDPPPTVINWNAERVKRGKPVVFHQVEPLPGASLLPSGDTSPSATPCTHEQVCIDAKERLVYCQACDADLDAIWVLMRYALKEREFLRNRESTLSEQKKLRAETERLKVERQKARNGVNRDPMGKRIRELEKRAQTLESTAREYRQCYLDAKVKLEAVGKKARKPLPWAVAGVVE